MEDWLKCQISPLVKYRQNKQILHIYLSMLQEYIINNIATVWGTETGSSL